MENIENDGVLCVPAINCISCGMPGDILHDQLVDTEFSAPGKWNLRQCRACELAWVDPRPLPSEITKFYRTYYTHESSGDTRNAYETRGKKKLIKRILSKVLLWRSELYLTDYFYLEGLRPGRLLEVGCGNGDFLQAAAYRGWEAIGLDFDENAVRQANSRPGVCAHVQEVVTADYPANSFDAIVMNNVVEHLRNPAETLKKSRELLRKGGRLIMITPNISSVGHRIFGRYWRGLEPPRHLFLYNVRSLKSVCRGAGFTRLVVGTSSGGAACQQMFLSSIKIAARHSVASPLKPWKIPMIAAFEYATSILGGRRGEWLVLIATK